ncbi:hypothetical protein E4Q23_14460 [Candidatus Accumulibacter phosphatis]|uniref:Uncharacterized protein n=1 Tax=Candidatus Accumulibacter phosphatis TaxID=327160 RepID=A0ABX1U0K8_9PROT|nr:hypothetical protein [Candidatus Accumulibacter phosphatis]
MIFFDEPRLVVIVRVLSSQFVISCFSVIPESLLARALKFKIRALVNLGAQLAGGALTLALAFSGYGVWSLVAGAIFSTTINMVGVNFAAPYLHWPHFSFLGAGTLISFGGKVTAGRVLWFFLFSGRHVCCWQTTRQRGARFLLSCNAPCLPAGAKGIGHP